MRIIKDIEIKKIRNKKFTPYFSMTPDTVDKKAMEGNISCLNFCLRRFDFLPEFNKKLYYGHIEDLGYVICEDEIICNFIDKIKLKKLRRCEDEIN